MAANETGDIRDVIARLHAIGVPSCIVGVRALRYYGAGRIILEWDLCIPDECMGKAGELFTSTHTSRGQDFKPAPPPLPAMMSLRHTFPTFKKSGIFYVVLTPASDAFVDPSRPENCELSRTGVTYPNPVQFARSLLAQQNLPDLEDFIDGMDLDCAWGVENLDFENLQKECEKYAWEKNERMREVWTDDTACECVELSETGYDVAKVWKKITSTKTLRIDPEKKGRYLTRWMRIRTQGDPRLLDRPHV